MKWPLAASFVHGAYVSQWRHRAVIQLHESARRVVATAVAVGVAAGLIEYSIHVTVTELAIPRLVIAVLDSTIAATITALCVYLALAAARARRRALLQHLRNVAELNHEVRNALQMIVYSKYFAPQEQTEAVLKSVDRIEKALQDLFPASINAHSAQRATHRNSAPPLAERTGVVEPPPPSEQMASGMRERMSSLNLGAHDGLTPTT